MRRDYSSELRGLFYRNNVLDLVTISQSFPNRSKISLIRDLNKIGAISSCNHRGQHYTLMEIAVFNNHGLWHYNDALFSAHGNLKHTITSIVNESKEGMTHNDLRAILNLRVHDTLLEMVEDNKITREVVDGVYVYMSADLTIKMRQVEGGQTSVKHNRVDQIDPKSIIEVLSYIIRKPQTTAIDAYSQFEYTGLSQGDVDEIFERYVLVKKN